MENLELNADQVALAEGAHRAAAECPRDDISSAARHIGGYGLGGVLAPDAVGGLGLGALDALVIACAVGNHLVDFPVVETMIASRIISGIDSDIARSIVNGEDIAVVAWGDELPIRRVEGHWQLRGIARRVPLAQCAHWLLVRVRHQQTGSQAGVAIVDLKAPGITVHEEREFDVGRPTASITVSDMALAGSAVDFDERAISFLQDTGDLLRSGEMLGCAETSFAATCTHVSTRRQFGRTLASNQVIRHMLARDHLELAGARLSLLYAASSVDAMSSTAAKACLVAVESVLRTCKPVAENAIQLHGAMGFSWELPLHRRLRRILQLSGYLDGVATRNRLFDLLQRSDDLV